MPEYIPIIGMEVHVELNTKSKMFCSCKNDPFAAEPNTHICEICLGHPGTLPVPNKRAVEWAVRIGKALGCTIRERSKFDRKHYFYPDLPKAYQISQYDEPIAEHGEMVLRFPLEENIRDEAHIGIRRAHLEEDTAKLQHTAGGDTVVDFNRAGVPLVEIVTDPSFRTALEAKTYCQELRSILRTLGVSNADMEKGEMRCEANISVQRAGSFEIVDGEVRPLGDAILNAKVELKNLNSFKAVEKGIAYEIERQIRMSDAGESWEPQTRGWNEDKEETVLQRAKESAADYRYFPEPDIPPFHPAALVGGLSVPELPLAKRERFHSEYGFSYADAKLLSLDRGWADFTEAVMSELVEWLHTMPEVDGDSDAIREDRQQKMARLASTWIVNRLMAQIQLEDLHISAENFAEFVALIYTEKVNSTNAQKLLSDMLALGTNVDPTHILEEKGYGQVRDEGKLADVIDMVIREYPAQVEQFRAGKEPVLKFLIGMAMKATEGTADPVVLEKLLREKL